MCKLNHLRNCLVGHCCGWLLVQAFLLSCCPTSGYGSLLTSREELSSVQNVRRARFVRFSRRDHSGTCQRSDCPVDDLDYSSSPHTRRPILNRLRSLRSESSEPESESNFRGRDRRHRFERMRSRLRHRLDELRSGNGEAV